MEHTDFPTPDGIVSGAESTSEFVTVDTHSGTVRGRWRNTTGGRGLEKSAAFLGIPFAQPPVGENRFDAPVPVAPWEGVRDALDFGATAQRGDPGVTLIPEPSIEGESTLNVNVFTPTPTQAAPGNGLPVLVWIHGGGYFAGSPASPWYDGRNFNRDSVVTVTLSYRLGFDGFGWIEDAPSNRGVRDWLAALEWVQDNISLFGGDPGQVTIAGQSAGGGAVLTLLGMEKAQHLFRGVIAISGALADTPLAKAEEFSRKYAGLLGVEPTRAGLSTKTEAEHLVVQKDATKMDPSKLTEIIEEGLGLGPCVDGDLIMRPTIESLRMGVGSDKRLVIGSTDDEFTMAMGDAAKILRWVPRSILMGKFGVPKHTRKQYLADNADVAAKGKANLAGRILTDLMFRRAVLNIADARGSAPTWIYRFSWPSGTFGFAEHCLDVPFFFDCLDGPAMVPLAGENPPQQLADELHADAVRFIQGNEPTWPRYTQSEKTGRVYNVPSYTLPDAYASVASLR